jgi:GNAT superfamily N-acetyltransferase
MPIRIRPATRADARTFLSLIDALADYEHLDPPRGAARQRLVRHALGPPTQRRIEVFLADCDRVAVGYAVIFETYSTFLALPTLYLEDIFVLPKHRGDGAGRALFLHCARLALKRGCGRMEWSVLDWNTPAQGFYERLGARRLREWLPYRMTRKEITALARHQR